MLLTRLSKMRYSMSELFIQCVYSYGRTDSTPDTTYYERTRVRTTLYGWTAMKIVMPVVKKFPLCRYYSWKHFCIYKQIPINWQSLYFVHLVMITDHSTILPHKIIFGLLFATSGTVQYGLQRTAIAIYTLLHTQLHIGTNNRHYSTGRAQPIALFSYYYRQN